MSTKIDKVGQHLNAFKETTPKQVKPTEEVAEVNSSTTSEASQKLKVPAPPSVENVESLATIAGKHVLKVNEQIGDQKKEKIKPVPKM